MKICKEADQRREDGVSSNNHRAAHGYLENIEPTVAQIPGVGNARKTLLHKGVGRQTSPKRRAIFVIAEGGSSTNVERLVDVTPRVRSRAHATPRRTRRGMARQACNRCQSAQGSGKEMTVGSTTEGSGSRLVRPSHLHVVNPDEKGERAREPASRGLCCCPHRQIQTRTEVLAKGWMMTGSR